MRFVVLTAFLKATGWEVIKIEPHIHLVTLEYIAKEFEAYSKWASKILGEFVSSLVLKAALGRCAALTPVPAVG